VKLLVDKASVMRVALMAELESNRRLIRLLWATFYILAMYIFAGLNDKNESLAIVLAQMERQASRSVDVDDLQRWAERLVTEEETQSVLVKGCWSAPSARLASADMQTLLQQLTGTYLIKNVRLTLSPPLTQQIAGREAWEIRAQIVGKATPSKLLSFVNALDKPSSYFGIERLLFSEKRNGLLNLMLYACFVEDPQ
jgi:hypothetical protein